MKRQYALAEVSDPAKFRKHGMSKTKFYYVWLSMRDRCSKPSFHNYHSYGGRGIKCMWKSFLDFKHDMYDSYVEHKNKHGRNTQIERIDNNGPYSRDNCRWSTRLEQMRNTRRTVFVFYEGTTYTKSEISKKFGMLQSSFNYYQNKGLSVEQISRIKIKRRKRK